MVLVISIMAICFIFPIYWTIAGSFKHLTETMKFPPELFPQRLVLDNYRRLFSRTACFRWIFNTVIISIAATSINVTTACFSGYAFAKKEFPGKNLIFWTLLATSMIPFHVTIIPLFLTIKKLGLYNTHLGITISMVLGAGYMFLARQYMSTIPSELIDAARVDGATEFGVFHSIILPISKPLIAALCIFSFIGIWSTFFWPLILSNTDKARTLAVGVVLLSSGGIGGTGGEINFGILMAGAVVASVPMYIIFFYFQGYFVKGVTMGGMKG